MDAEQPVPRFFLILMVATTLVLGAVVLPVAGELLMATVLAAILWPVRCWLTRHLGDRPGVAAGLLTIVALVILVGPVATFVTIIVRDGSDGLRFVSDTARSVAVAEMVAELPDGAQVVVRDAIASLPRDLGEALGQVGEHRDQAATAVGAAVRATGSFLFHATMMFIALFFFLVRGEEILTWLDSVSPLRSGQTRELLAAFRRVSYAVIMSTVVTSAVQAAAALLGYYIARVPNPIFFATVTFFVAFIPAIGAAVVCLVAALVLVVTGHPVAAGFLAVWGLIVVGLVDNVIRPLLIRRGMEIHGGVVFFSLIGGLAAFGGIGLLIGPLVVSLFLALLRMYHRDFSPGEARIPKVPGLPPGSSESRG